MGPRIASLRHPNVVMAPALTEAGQSNFKLSTTLDSSPFSPVALSTYLDTKSDKCNIITESFQAKVTHGDCFKEGSLPYIAASNIHLNELTDKHDGAVKFPLRALRSIPSREEVEHNCSKGQLLKFGGLMMNSSYPSMGDQEENMGLLKSCSDICGVENYLKEKVLPGDVEQLFKNIGATITNSDIGGGGDLGQNVEEILQVIKNMESVNSNDIVTPLSGDQEIGQMDSVQSGDGEGIFPISDGTDISGSLSNLFNDVDMMNMCVDEHIGETTGHVTASKETVIKDKKNESQKRQFAMERKCDWLFRRLRKMQARYMGRHIGEEVTGTLEHANEIVKDPNNVSKFVAGQQSHTNFNCDGQLKSDTKTNVSPNPLKTLMKRFEQSSFQQANVASQQNASFKYFGSGSSGSANVNLLNSGLRTSGFTGALLPKLSTNVRQELEEVSGHLHTQLKMVESGVDSDVTASSSGGESCDEMQSFNNPHQQHLTISKRAAWRWAQDRAGVASRWTWLTAQISDLEFRIRTHKEIYKQLRLTKGSVVLGGEESVSENVVVNGYHGAKPAKVEEVSVSCRTRPLVRSSLRKRKLLATLGLHNTSKRAAKPSTVRCGCRPPLASCALCTGRVDPTHPRDNVHWLTVPQRIASLDPAFHPVLSFPNDVSQSIHFEAVMRTTDWQQGVLRSNIKSQGFTTAKVLLPSDSQERRLKKIGGLNTLIHRAYTLKKSTANTLSAKIKKKLSRRGRPKILRDTNNFTLDRNDSLKMANRLCPSALGSCGEAVSEPEEDSLDGGDWNPPSPSRSPTPVSSHYGKDQQRRKREFSYDIDNIVIPYSVAAATRVEKLQYKEILTPKWRFAPVEPLVPMENKNGVVRRTSQESDVEDMGDEAVVARHDRCEVDERKKFSSYLKLPNSVGRPRGPRHHRTDSRAESSGANTPDPMSPNVADQECVSPMISPPATPLPIDVEEAALLVGSAANSLVSGRRRTFSLSRWPQDTRPTTPTESLHDDEVAPYEPRTFPLSDDAYEKMLKVMPVGHPFKAQDMMSKYSECGSRPISPASFSTDSADSICGDEDPNDPEWTVDNTTVEKVGFKR